MSENEKKKTGEIEDNSVQLFFRQSIIFPTFDKSTIIGLWSADAKIVSAILRKGKMGGQKREKEVENSRKQQAL